MRQLTLGASFNKYYDGSELASVTCLSSTSCVAVGSDGSDEPLIVTGNPATWTAAQARDIKLGQTFGYGGFLQSVACTSATACVAVGYDFNDRPLVLVGDPATWTTAQVHDVPLGAAFGQGGGLSSVICTSSSSCVAVGYDEHGMPMLASGGTPSTWTAAQMREISLGSAFGWGGSLYSLACVSSSSCVAVGTDGHNQPLELTGNPSTWAAAQAHEVTLGGSYGAGGSLASITCTSSSSCVSVGTDSHRQPLLVAGDPSTTWTAAQAQEVSLGDSFSSGGQLASIACASSSNCVATGIDANSQPLLLSGDPSTWGAAQAQEFAVNGVQYGAEAYPSSLTCTSNTACLDVGSYYSFTGASSYFIQGHPATWNQASAVLMTGISPDSYLAGNVCPSSTYCVAVGQDGITGEPLVLTGDPSTWGTASGRVITLGSPFGAGGGLNSIACSSTTSCVAVGSDYKGQVLVMTGDPATWTSANAKEIVIPKKFHSFGSLDSVVCTSASACVAVGEDGSYLKRQPIVLSGDPSSWTVSNVKQITMSTALGSIGSLYSVSCTSATYCVAVGDSGSAVYKPLVLAGNPANWKTSNAYNLAAAGVVSTAVGGLAGYGGGGKGKGYLISVSCESATYCVIVGGDKRSAPLYLAGNPTKWKGHLLARPTKQAPAFLTAELATSVCTTTACFAGGVANGGDFVASISGG